MSFQPWPFDDPPNVAVFTERRVLSGEQSILLVAHDSDDGAWQFLVGDRQLSNADAAIVSLAHIAQMDSTIAQLADLPLGWTAVRDSVAGEWRREPTGEAI